MTHKEGLTRVKKADTVRLYPTLDFHVPGVPAVEQDVTPERAAELLAWSPAAFTTDPPDPPPDVPVAPPQDPPHGGSSDSSQE